MNVLVRALLRLMLPTLQQLFATWGAHKEVEDLALETDKRLDSLEERITKLENK